MKCKICNEKITSKRYKYCPICGGRLDGRGGEYYLDKISYLWEREKSGELIYNNFKTIKQAGILAVKDTKPIRCRLGDFSHMYLHALYKYSFLYLVPQSKFDFYKIGKLYGYLVSHSWLNTLKFGSIIGILSKTELFWNIFAKISEKQKDGWVKLGFGIPNLVEINRDDKYLIYRVEDTENSIFSSEHPLCFMEVGGLCGQSEILSGKFLEGIETKCRSAGDQLCEIKVHIHDLEKEPIIKPYPKEEMNSILDQTIGDVVCRGNDFREKLGDSVHVSIEQVVNYVLVSKTSGHAVLSKHSGVICGERIAKKANLEGQEAALDYANNLFLYLKTGILHKSETRGDSIILKMDESVYSSGVNNINMKLDIFLAGIIEGLLKQSTGEKWRVEETKCLANGDDYCEFNCKKQT